MAVVQISFFVAVLLIVQCHGAFRFANYYQDNMVLQRTPRRAVIWGFGNSNALTTLKISTLTYTTISRAEIANEQNESIWSVKMNAVYSEGPFNITVSQLSASGILLNITIRNVLFGDVWICSGQSNMQMTMGMIYNATEEIQNAGNYSKIRVMAVMTRSSPVPLEELMSTILRWSVASPYSIGGYNWGHMSAVCWLYGRRIHEELGGRPIGLIATSWVGTSIEFWSPPEALEDCNATTAMVKPTATLINDSLAFNSMIYPLTRMVIFGSIWYQGEANVYDTRYACKFAKMIQYWRQTWNERTNGSTDIQFPFGFVQLSTNSINSVWVGGFPQLRWQQTFNVGYVPNSVVPKVFMAVALDLRDDPNNIHPKTKQDVGYRLSRAGLAVAYGQQVEYRGPIVQKVSYTNGSQTVNITYTAVTGLDQRSSTGFEVCCQGANCGNNALWLPAPITNKNGLTITLAVNSSCVGKALYGVRYLWRETPCPFKQAALYSSTDANLPSPPYMKLF